MHVSQVDASQEVIEKLQSVLSLISGCMDLLDEWLACWEVEAVLRLLALGDCTPKTLQFLCTYGSSKAKRRL